MRARMTWLSIFCALLALAVVAGACGADDGQTSGGSSTGGATSSSATSASADPAHLVGLGAAGDADASPPGGSGNLLHVHLNGANDVRDDLSAAGISCGPELNWASSHPDQAAYTTQQLQDVYTYMHTAPFDRFDLPLAGAGAPGVGIPSALRWVNAAQAQNQQTCRANLQVTNTSTAPITISQVGVHYLAAPIANTYQYARIDVCTIDPARYCLSGRGGQTGACAYTAEVPLESTGGAGTEIPGNINPVGPGCPAVVPLAPGQVIVIHLVIDPPSTGLSQMYQIAPTLTVGDSPQHVIVLSGLHTSLAFADASQFTCYGESNGRVVPDSAIQYPLTDAQGTSYPKPLCI